MVVVGVWGSVGGGVLVVELVAVVIEVELVDVAGGGRNAACWWWWCE